MKVRLALPRETVQIAQLALRAYGHYPARIGVRPGPLDAHYSAKVHDDLVWVADRSAVAGYVILVPHPDHLLIENIAVDPRFQGLGIGRDLMAFAESRAQHLGLTQLRLFTHVAMVENRQFYSRLGYREVEVRRESEFARVFFEKDLAC